VIKIEVDDRGVIAALNELLRRGGDLSPAMASIGAELLSLTEGAFAAQGPGWPPLAPSTIKGREKRGKWPGKMLQLSAGGLAASIQVESGADYVEIGSAKEYAAIHQFGGQAGRGHQVTIPARRYLPVSAQGELGAEARESILDILNDYLAQAWKG
jgi:phage virion morphogenesis protein